MDETSDESGTVVEPTARDRLRTHLERFAGPSAVETAPDGTLRATFGDSTFVAVAPDGHVSTGMPLHGFDAPADRLRFDHEVGTLYVDAGAVSYIFRRP